MDERAERFSRVFEAGYEPLHAFARRRCSPEDADDLVADVMTVAWRRLDDIPPDAVLPWLYGVARRMLANQHRGRGRRARLLARLQAEPAGAAASPGSRVGEPGSAPVLDALARLRAGDQEVLRLAAWEQLGPAQIAVVLGCSANAAALRLSRARRRLRRAVTDLDPTRTGVGRKERDG